MKFLRLDVRYWQLFCWGEEASFMIPVSHILQKFRCRQTRQIGETSRLPYLKGVEE